MLELLAEGAYVEYRELPIPTIAYGIITLGIFAALGIVTMSFTNVSNKHTKVDPSETSH
jgi:Na+/proline symporter